MNIFVVDENPILAAQDLCNKHNVKMVLESAQMLCSVFPNGEAPYRRTHYNHPCSKWVRQSKQNYEWLVKHGMALCKEYTKRYERVHKSQEVIKWCKNNYHTIDFHSQSLTPFVKEMPEKYRGENTVEAYRDYYRGDKKDIAIWPPNGAPSWW